MDVLDTPIRIQESMFCGDIEESVMACPLGGETCTEATHFLRRPAEGPLEQERDALL